DRRIRLPRRRRAWVVPAGEHVAAARGLREFETPARDYSRHRLTVDNLFVKHDLETCEPRHELSVFEQVIGRTRTYAERPLMHRERFVQREPTRNERVANRRKEIALQVPRDEDDPEPRSGQRRTREIRSPAPHDQLFGCRSLYGLAD